MKLRQLRRQTQNQRDSVFEAVLGIVMSISEVVKMEKVFLP